MVAAMQALSLSAPNVRAQSSTASAHWRVQRVGKVAVVSGAQFAGFVHGSCGCNDINNYPSTGTAIPNAHCIAFSIVQSWEAERVSPKDWDTTLPPRTPNTIPPWPQKSEFDSKSPWNTRVRYSFLPFVYLRFCHFVRFVSQSKKKESKKTLRDHISNPLFLTHLFLVSRWCSL